MKWKRTCATCRFLSLFLGLCLLLTGIPLTVHAAEYTTVISEKTGKEGLTDYPGVAVHYVIDKTKTRLTKYSSGISNVVGAVNTKNATVTYQKKDANGNWVADDSSPFGFGRTAWQQTTNTVRESGLYIKTEVKANTNLTITDHRVKITFPNAVIAHDGTRRDLFMTLSGFTVSNKSSTDYKNLAFMSQTNGLLSFCSYLYGATGWATNVGIHYNIGLSVANYQAGERLFIAFNDIDQPGFDDSYTSPYRENISIRSGICANTQPHVPKDYLVSITNGATPTYYATRMTDGGVESWQASMSYLGNAGGTTFRWTGAECGTYFGLSKDDLDSFEAETKVRVETENSPVLGNAATRTYTNYWSNKAEWYLILMAPVTYSDSYSMSDLLSHEGLSSDYSWMFDFNGQTINETISTNKTWYIDINRNRFTYWFFANPPAGKSIEDVTGMPDSKTVVAGTGAAGMSDATVASPSLSGYRFKGWTANADGTGEAYPGAETMKSTKKFYAQWEPATYKVHFNANGSVNPDHQDGERTQNTTTGAMADQELYFDQWANLSANAFGREGYTFAGWNTKSDGTGTAYTDQQSVCNLVGQDKSEITLYAQWTKKLGTEMITVVSEETGNPVANVGMTLQKNVNGTWTDVVSGTTGNDGKIGVNNLHWFDYRWVMTDVPAGYVKSADTAFSINYNQLSAENSVILYLKHVKIILDSQVSDIIKGEQAPAFLYQIEGIDAAGVNHTYNLLVQTDVNSKFGTNQIPDLFAGTYTVTQTPVSRYCPETAVNVSNSTVDGINASVDVLNQTSAEVKFPYTIREYGWYYGVGSVVNHLTK